MSDDKSSARYLSMQNTTRTTTKGMFQRAPATASALFNSGHKPLLVFQAVVLYILGFDAIIIVGQDIPDCYSSLSPVSLRLGKNYTYQGGQSKTSAQIKGNDSLPYKAKRYP